MFDHHLLDMVELGIDAFCSITDFDNISGGSATESKPCILFEGADWEHSAELQVSETATLFCVRIVIVCSPNSFRRPQSALPEYLCHVCPPQAIRSILLDFFQLRVVEAISAIGIEHVLCFSTTVCSLTSRSDESVGSAHQD